MKKDVIFVTGTRADYGILFPVIELMHNSDDFNVKLIATSMHLSPNHGFTYNEIEKSGFNICGKVDNLLQNPSHANMAKSIGIAILGITDILEREKPDALIVLGDRGEMLAAAISAAHLNIPVVHLHGGEVSGSIDESVRHAISKIAHIHFTSTLKSAERLMNLGEKRENVHFVGAPRLDTILHKPLIPLESVASNHNIEIQSKNYFLLIYHPVSTEKKGNIIEFENILKRLEQTKKKVLIILPNSDAGNDEIRKLYLKYNSIKRFIFIENFNPDEYLTILKNSSILIGNSSSGIIEAGAYKIPVINIGNRQNNRERTKNIVSINTSVLDFEKAMEKIESSEFQNELLNFNNIYGDGNACEKIYFILKGYNLNNKILEKVITY